MFAVFIIFLDCTSINDACGQREGVTSCSTQSAECGSDSVAVSSIAAASATVSFLKYPRENVSPSPISVGKDDNK